ncbi:hypothetical protein AMECASPLE_000115 [Ameca splendens]|uniref:Uncharacterized protein n=1 Tax=Ameca splendens TaxID=208324 RepID=A0ABV0Y9B9_9TELE
MEFACAWVPSRYSGFILQSKNMNVGLSGLSQLPLETSVCMHGDGRSTAVGDRRLPSNGPARISQLKHLQKTRRARAFSSPLARCKPHVHTLF